MSLYSKCTPVKNTTQYECLCPKDTFRVTKTGSLGLLGRDLRLEYCEDVDECAEGKCRGSNKTCINTIGSFECNCNKEYKMNATQDCVPVCSDVNCGHGVCKESGNNGFWCQCEDGYSGENCGIQASGQSLLSLSLIVRVNRIYMQYVLDNDLQKFFESLNYVFNFCKH